MHVDVIGGALEGVIDDHGPASRAILRLRHGEENTFALLIIDSLVEDRGTALDSTAIWFRMPVHPARHGRGRTGSAAGMEGA
jgi:hypothetical protein